jgi:hypothetical protein
MKWISCLLILSGVLSSVGHADLVEEVRQEYRARYDDFFERLRRQELEDKKRLAGRSEVAERRQERQELLERARKNFAQSRPLPKDLSKAYQEDLEKKMAEQKAYLKIQELYAQKQRELEKIKQGALKIPPVIEYQLQEAL